MGLEGSVMCTCYALGNTSPSPFPDRFFLNSAGFPDLKPAENSDPEADMQRLYEWLQNCCDHPGMEYASIYLSNWPGYMDFIDALDKLGADRFPTLTAELPGEDGGLISAASAAIALQELAAFRRLEAVDTKMFVVNAETHERLYSHVPEHGGVFIWDGRNGFNLGVDRHGLFIMDAWENGRVVFRAWRMEQTLLEPDLVEQTGSGRVVYTDVDSGKRFECRTPIPGKEIPWPDGEMRNAEGRFRLEYPRLLQAEEQPLNAAYFDFIVEPLETIFRAAVETGNPVRWF
jgi:hypothetical protein